MTSESISLKMETERLREEVKDETRKKQVAESSYKMLCEEKGEYRKVPKLSDARKLCRYLPKIQTKKPNLRGISLKRCTGNSKQ